MTTVFGASYLAQNKENLLAFSINNAQLWPNKFFFISISYRSLDKPLKETTLGF